MESKYIFPYQKSSVVIAVVLDDIKEVSQERRAYLLECLSCSNQLKMEFSLAENGNLPSYFREYKV